MSRRLAETIGAAAIYGFSAGAVHSFRLAAWSALKFPLLLLATILLCSLVWQCFSRLLAPALRPADVASLAPRTFHLTALFLASLSPVTFFLARTIDQPDARGLGEYPLVLGLNVGLIALCGTVALGLETRRLAARSGLGPGRAVAVLGAWLAVCLFAGGQCAWYMRPFFGPATIRNLPFMEGTNPDFRGARSFYEAVFHLVRPPPLSTDYPMERWRDGKRRPSVAGCPRTRARPVRIPLPATMAAPYAFRGAADDVGAGDCRHRPLDAREHAMDFVDRAVGSFLGLALGDAFGRTLEFLSGEAVRKREVVVAAGEFDWTDDTHMALYLAEAVLDHGPGPLDEDAFGRAVGEAFGRWLDDPLMPLTAPGHTCIAGVRNWRRTRDWRTSGVADSDGCGAVMRVVPLGIAFAGMDLDRAAAISARLTHGHPNAAAAAVATCRLLRTALERGRFDAALVAEVAAGLTETGVVVDALRAALPPADGPWDGWLDERAIPPGDGGWRSPSALGLAVAAALRWGRDFETAIEKAARIDGDSDSVAALAGMFLGAAGGTAVLPPAFVAAVKDRDRIEDLARRVSARGAPPGS